VVALFLYEGLDRHAFEEEKESVSEQMVFLLQRSVVRAATLVSGFKGDPNVVYSRKIGRDGSA
jgi:hypothetical protein